MSRSAVTPPPRTDIGVQVGLVVAAAQVPGTFAPGLTPRSDVDQGLVTALATGLHYLLAARHPGRPPGRRRRAGPHPRRRPVGRPGDAASGRSTLAADLAAVPLGLALQRVLPTARARRWRAAGARQTGWRAASTGVAALGLEAARVGLRALDERLGAGGRVARLPVAVPLGLAIAFARRPSAAVSARDDDARSRRGPAPGALAPRRRGRRGRPGRGGVRRAPAGGGRRAAAGDRLPGGPLVWRLATHGASLGALAVGASHAVDRAMRSHRGRCGGRRAGARRRRGHPVDRPDPERWAGQPRAVGHARQGGPPAHAHPRAAGAGGRPAAGVPDLSIETVMGEPALAAPVQVYVGLDSAPTAPERVDLALAEMERTGAFDRSLLMLVSPTGLGYVNYVAMAAAQYLTRGDVASVTMQYSKRPSPLSLGRVGQAREQNRLLWLRILERLRHRRRARARGSSCSARASGAHTSQDVFLHWGTLGPARRSASTGRCGSAPRTAAGGCTRSPAPTASTSTGRASPSSTTSSSCTPSRTSAAARPRYVLLSHDNDGVTRFGVDLLTTAPAWLGPGPPAGRARSPGASPRGIPRAPAVAPGDDVLPDPRRHEERAGPGDLPGAGATTTGPTCPRFVSEVYDLRRDRGAAGAGQPTRCASARSVRWEVFQED